MINLLAEGRAYHEMKCFIQRYPELQYSFCRNDLQPLLTAFRYSQNKLKSEGKLSLYPKQLMILARYYYYHYQEDQEDIRENDNALRSEEKVRELLCDWIDTLCHGLEQSTGFYVPRSVIENFKCPWFQIPLHSNNIPLDVVLKEAYLAGRLDQSDYTNYPSPEGLPLENGEFVPSGITPEQFWKTQLAKMARIEADYQRDKKKKEVEKKGQDIESDLTDSKKLSYYARSRRVHSMFVLAVWYAQQYKACRARMQEINMNSPEPDNDLDQLPRILIETERLHRSVMEFSSNLDECLSSYTNMIFKLAVTFGDEKNSAIGFLYSSDQEEEAQITLPRWEELDDGYRIRESEIYYYGWKLGMLKVLLNPELDLMLSNNDQVYEFKIRESDEDIILLAEKALTNSFMDFAEPMMKVRKSLDAVWDNLQKASSTNHFSEKERAEFIRKLNTELIGKVESKKIPSFNNPKAEPKNLREIFKQLVLGRWKKYCSNDHLSDLMEKKIQDYMKTALLTAENPIDAFAEMIARARTLTVLLLQDSAVNETSLWHMARHLNIPESLLKEEKIFYDKLQEKFKKSLDKTI